MLYPNIPVRIKRLRCSFYFRETQKSAVKRFVKLDIRNGAFLSLGLNARRNLELTETMRNKERKGSLLWVLDKTDIHGKTTPKTMDRTTLNQYKRYFKQLDAVEDLMKNITALGDFCLANAVYDLDVL